MMINSPNTLAADDGNLSPSIKNEADFNRKDNVDIEMPYLSDLDVDLKTNDISSRRILSKRVDKLLVINVQELKNQTLMNHIINDSSLREDKFTLNKLKQFKSQWSHEIWSMATKKLGNL
ncbi:hypothetical protein AYI68_g7511 [Smittium mucronatum]|uniref:Uncharacterized protein n=1 Tax=Smittium mucronatum TaxID=133383 RepID=A0A1R0GNI3_9FUNG|nr:hypothetical protein AYI68_g7511 [Smittium mucronatum]